MRYLSHLLTLALALSFSVAAHSDESADPATRYRHQSMKAASAHMKAIGELLRHPLPFSEQLPMHTRAMAEFADAIPAMFPRDADYFESEAEEAIWEKWDEFRQRAGATAKAARAVEQAFAAGDLKSAGDSYSRLRRSCKACHDDFRQ